MSKKVVPDEDHLMRYVPFSQQFRDPDTEAFLGISNAAFRLRESDKGHMSLTWVEYYGVKNQATLGIAAGKFRDSLTSQKLAKKAYFAIGTCGNTKAMALQYKKKVRIVHAPEGANQGHVEVRQFLDDDFALLDALAQEVFLEHVAVNSLKLD